MSRTIESGKFFSVTITEDGTVYKVPKSGKVDLARIERLTNRAVEILPKNFVPVKSDGKQLISQVPDGELARESSKKWYPDLYHKVKKIIETLKKHGIQLGDMNPSNVFYDSKTDRVIVIDTSEIKEIP